MDLKNIDDRLTALEDLHKGGLIVILIIILIYIFIKN
jgi:hypothetical protein